MWCVIAGLCQGRAERKEGRAPGGVFGQARCPGSAERGAAGSAQPGRPLRQSKARACRCALLQPAQCPSVYFPQM